MAMITRVSRNAMINPVVQLMTHVINHEDSHHILQTDFSGMESLLQDISTLFFRDQQKAPPEIVKVWLQLLHNSLTEAERLLSIDNWGRRQRCVDCIVNNPRRPSKQIRHWKAFFDHLYRCFQSDVSISVTSLHFLSSKPLYKEDSLHQGVATASGFVGSGIIDAEAQVKRWLNKGNRVHLIGVYGMPGVGKTSLLKMLYDAHEVSNVFDRKIWVRNREDYTIFDLQRAIRKQIDEDEACFYSRIDNFLLVLEDLWSPLDLQEVGVAFGDGKHSKVLFSTSRKDLIGEMGAEESIEIQPLSTDEGWMLFRRLAFKDDPAIPMDIEERAMRFAEECMGVPLAIKLVAAMIGQTPVDEWDACFSLLQKNNIHVDPSFPAAHPRLLDAPQLYTLLRWTYDALPSSNLKNCFLYCAMYKEDEVIDSRQLVEMWIGEGLVKSKQGTHLMDMAIGRSYLKLLIDRCFFQIVKQSRNVFRRSGAIHDVFPSIRVHHALIREMAVYIAQKEENCLLMGSQNLRNFPEAHYENCRRISFPDGDLPADLRFPILSTLILHGNTHVKELPTQFLVNLTSLRVLNLSGCTGITSVPSSVWQLTLLQFLSLSKLPIEALPEEVCHLSELQFLDLSRCELLDSLPSQIAQLRNLKHLRLDFCESLKMIPRELSELTSLSRLQLWTDLSVEMEAPARIWSLKGLKSLTELNIWIDTRQQDGKRTRIKDGIMGTWTEMRHLNLSYNESYEDDLLPEDMQNMKKLQSFMLYCYKGLSLLNCKFEHLEMVKLHGCDGITKLCPLERLPNLKILKLVWCDNLRELGMGSPGAYVSLQKLVLRRLDKLERLDGASQSGEVWDERTLPQLRVLRIRGDCSSLKRLPRGMEKLQNLCAIISSREWWEGIVWDDDNMEAKLQQIFRPREL